MIKILIVEDDGNKAKQIERVINDNNGGQGISINNAQDIVSAKRLLQRESFDLLILDIQIPNRIGQQPQQDGGLKLLDIIRDRHYIMPAHVIGITGFSDSFEEAQPVFEKKLLYVIRYERESVEWIEKLGNKIRDLLAWRRSNIKQGYNYDLALITALDRLELQAVLALPGNWKPLSMPNDNTFYYEGTFEGGTSPLRVVAAASVQMGMTAASILTMKMVQHFRPRYLCMVGIAAGVKGKVQLGDILVADQSWDYNSGKLLVVNGENRFLPDGTTEVLDVRLKSVVNNLAFKRTYFDEIRTAFPAENPEHPLSLHVGPVASGSAVVADRQVVEGIIAHNRRVIGLEMETYGVYAAANSCTEPRPVVISIKSVCDFADHDKNDRCQPYAAFTSAQFLYRFARDYLAVREELLADVEG